MHMLLPRKRWFPATSSSRVLQGQAGKYSTYLFEERIEAVVTSHKAEYPDAPMFLYYPMQNVHEPLESPRPITDPYINATCDKIVNADRRVFCQMAMLADSAIGNRKGLNRNAGSRARRGACMLLACWFGHVSAILQP